MFHESQIPPSRSNTYRIEICICFVQKVICDIKKRKSHSFEAVTLCSFSGNSGRRCQRIPRTSERVLSGNNVSQCRRTHWRCSNVNTMFGTLVSSSIRLLWLHSQWVLLVPWMFVYSTSSRRKAFFLRPRTETSAQFMTSLANIQVFYTLSVREDLLAFITTYSRFCLLQLSWVKKPPQWEFVRFAAAFCNIRSIFIISPVETDFTVFSFHNVIFILWIDENIQSVNGECQIRSFLGDRRNIFGDYCLLLIEHPRRTSLHSFLYNRYPTMFYSVTAF